MNQHTASAIAHIAFWGFAAVAVYSIASCGSQPYMGMSGERIVQLECIKQRGKWIDGACDFQVPETGR